MRISDVFVYEEKKAIFCDKDENIDVALVKKVEINGKAYDVLKAEVVHNIVGNKAIVLLLDTSDELSKNDKVRVLPQNASGQRVMIDDRPAKERLKDYEEKNGKLKPLTKEEKREYGLE